jgi:hypothetical protein
VVLSPLSAALLKHHLSCCPSVARFRRQPCNFLTARSNCKDPADRATNGEVHAPQPPTSRKDPTVRPEATKTQFDPRSSSRRTAFLLGCRAVAEILSSGQRGALPARTKLGLRLHLLLCGWCRKYRARLRCLSRILRGHSAYIEEAERLSQEGRDRLIRSVRNRGRLL